jgi:alcohol dehydrogenase
MTTLTATPAVAWQGPHRLEIVERDVATPGPGQLLIRISSVGVCGTDLQIVAGGNVRVAPGTILGHEFGGTVDDVGRDVSGWQPGQAVAVDPNLTCGRCRECDTGSRGRCKQRKLMGVDVDGGLRPFIVVDATQAIAVPGDPDPRSLSLVEPIAVGVHACVRGGITAGMAVGVIGGGAIGMAAALQARALGAATVTVIEPHPLRRAAIIDTGTDAIETLDRAAPRWDVAIDAVGNGSTITAAATAVQPGGTIAVVGLAHGADLPLVDSIVRRELYLTGAFCYTADDLRTAASLVARYGLNAIPVDLVHALDQVPRVLDALSRGRLGRGKTVIVP